MRMVHTLSVPLASICYYRTGKTEQIDCWRRKFVYNIYPRVFLIFHINKNENNKNKINLSFPLTVYVDRSNDVYIRKQQRLQAFLVKEKVKKEVENRVGMLIELFNRSTWPWKWTRTSFRLITESHLLPAITSRVDYVTIITTIDYRFIEVVDERWNRFKLDNGTLGRPDNS